MTQTEPSICVMGAGSIGCYVGGRLAAAGAKVSFIGRASLGETLSRHGLRLTDLRGADLPVSSERVIFSTEPQAAAGADLVLLTVKSADTRTAAEALAPHLTPGTVVVSFQNGLSNGEILAAALPQQTVVTGMVPFNVVNRGEGHFHHGSAGNLETARNPAMAAFLPLFAQAGLPIVEHDDMRAVLWAKLLLNLNNAVNALSGLPLKAELSQRAYRRCVALAQREALAVIVAEGVTPAKLTPLPPHWLPAALSVPDWLFRLLGNRMLAIDPLARSSMWEDLERGRKTEINWINGEVVTRARAFGIPAPVNGELVARIRDAEDGGRRDWSGPELLRVLANAAST